VSTTKVRRVVVFDDVLHARGDRFPGFAFPVEVHAHADDAELLGLGPEDVVCMDFEMGPEHRDGAEAVTELRRAGFRGRIVAMSSDPGCNLKMIAAGANESLAKKAMLAPFLASLSSGS
jgi:DNA-binding NarL/FixJ family response regulator